MNREIEVKFKSSYYGEFSEIFAVSNNDELVNNISEFLYDYMSENFEDVIHYLVEQCDCDYDSPFDDNDE